MMYDRVHGIADSIEQLIGNTPALRLKTVNDTHANIILKLEGENPMGSVKDRLALAIIDRAEKEGKLIPGKSIIVEATSGNTGVALAHIGAIRGYQIVITMPETMSLERRCLLRIFNAKLILTPASLGMRGAVAMAQKFVDENPHAVLGDQFKTKYNAMIHEETTGPEIWNQTKGNIDCFVSGVGTGGTITGVANYLKKKRGHNVHVVAVEPAESPVLAGGKPGPHKIQGIGAGFVPEVYKAELIDEVLSVSSDDAIRTAQLVAQKEGIFCGFSSGANIWAALRIARRPEMKGKNIVTVVPSFGERYLSTALYKSVRDEVLSMLPVSAADLDIK